MTKPSIQEKVVEHSPGDSGRPRTQPTDGATEARPPVADLHYFFDGGSPLQERSAPRRTLELAQSLLAALQPIERTETARTLGERIVTDGFLRSEADRDQNVYLGRLFTRHLTRAVPDLIFQPLTTMECATAFAWARSRHVPVTLRGAASAAMGGAVPNDGGLVLDLSRLDGIDLDDADGVVVVGAGARLRTIHQKLAERGRALRSYPSNLGGTLVGWFVTGGIGLNAYRAGRALDSVKAADVLLPGGEQVRFHDDGRLDVPDGRHRKTLATTESAAWFSSHGYAPFALADLAGSEGTYGLVLQLTVAIEPRPELYAFLLSFKTMPQALEAVAWIGGVAGSRFKPPANLKLLSGSHMHHVRAVWAEEDGHAWREQPSALSAGATLPWTRIVSPEEIGVTTGRDREQANAYLFVDFADGAAARAFGRALEECPGAPLALADESFRVGWERFKPQQTKRLGPGMLAAEIVMPAADVPAFLPAAEALAHGFGVALDPEVYYLADGSALVIAGYLTDHRCAAFTVDLMLAPALLDLAMARHHGKPYVLGRWQAAYFARAHGGAAVRLADIRRRLDPGDIVNRGVRYRPRLRGPLGALVAATMVPGVSMLRSLIGSSNGPRMAAAARRILSRFRGPAFGRGEPLGSDDPRPSADALHCVNCGECNSVCPIFHSAGIRLPQMLTHLGEQVHAGGPLPSAAFPLLDFCMRCGNCEEVCQAGIPHLPLYQVMQEAADRVRPPDRERHLSVLAAVRGSTRYTREFLQIRTGGYLKRTPASLPGEQRYVLLRAENDAGPAATCIHCGACVAVCPTGANHALEATDPRLITTEQERCIGCGTCVEVCPANLLNGGQTLRVMEAPTAEWYAAVEEFERR